MTNDFEHAFEEHVRAMLKHRVAGLPDSYAAPPGVVRRVRRRRASRLTAVLATVVLGATGATAAVAQVLGHQTSARVAVSSSATTPGRPVVTTSACPVNAVLAGQSAETAPAPSLAARIPSAGDPVTLRQLQSFALTDDPRDIVLGPVGWSCQASSDHDPKSIFVYDPKFTGATVADLPSAPIAVDDIQVRGVSSIESACAVSADPAVAALAEQMAVGCARPAGRVLTRVEPRVTEWVDAGGGRGAARLVLPSSPTGPAGTLSIVGCGPTHVSAAECEAIIADWVARVSVLPPTLPAATTNTTTPSTPTTSTTTTSAVTTPATATAPTTKTTTSTTSAVPAGSAR